MEDLIGPREEVALLVEPNPNLVGRTVVPSDRAGEDLAHKAAPGRNDLDAVTFGRIPATKKLPVRRENAWTTRASSLQWLQLRTKCMVQLPVRFLDTNQCQLGSFIQSTRVIFILNAIFGEQIDEVFVFNVEVIL